MLLFAAELPDFRRRAEHAVEGGGTVEGGGAICSRRRASLVMPVGGRVAEGRHLAAACDSAARLVVPSDVPDEVTRGRRRSSGIKRNHGVMDQPCAGRDVNSGGAKGHAKRPRRVKSGDGVTEACATQGGVAVTSGTVVAQLSASGGCLTCHACRLFYEDAAEVKSTTIPT